MIIINWLMDGGDVRELIETIKRKSNRMAVILLAARVGKEDEIDGLRAGADDYLAKPFLFEELLARINAQLRRAEFSTGILDFQSYDGVEINMKEQSATRDGKELNLSSRELKRLIFFMKNREKALS